MSAYIVSDEHLNYLISFAADHKVTWYDGETRPSVNGNEQAVFNKLFAANVASVNARYDENTPAQPGQFRWRHDAKPIQVLKACSCYDYQACDVDDYERTEAARIINAIRDAAIDALPGYEEAEWGVPERSQDHVVRLSDMLPKRKI